MEKEKKEIYERYENGAFDSDQLKEIKKGIENGQDVSVYARIGIPAEDMAYIRKFLQVRESIKEIEEPKEDWDKIDKEFEKYQETVSASVFEKAVVAAITVSGLSVIVELSILAAEFMKLLS